MKSHLNFLRHFLLSISLIVTSLSIVPAYAEVDHSLDDQKAECAKNTAAYWDNKLNRCAGKAEARATRHEVEDCSKIPDMEQRKACHLRVAEGKTGLNSNPDSLPEGTVGKSMIMNGAASAYAILGMINGLGSNGNKSSCTSKKIFAVTALAGTASDIWLKIRAKKKTDALKNKYQIDVKNSAYESQTKAFQYLKEEQETVKDIASMEKKRNMALMLGYGAASLMAIYELAVPEANPECFKKEAKEDTKCPEGQIKQGEACVPAPKPEEPPKAETEPAKPAEQLECTGGMTPGGNGTCVGAASSPEKIESRPLEDAPKDPPKQETTVVNQPADTIERPVETTPKEKFVVEERNGVKQIRSIDENGIKTDKAIVGNKIINYKTGAVVGTVDADKIEITRVGTSTPIASSDFKKIGVYQSGATDSASQIKFINNNGGTRTNVQGTTTIINDSKLKTGK